MNVDFLEGQLKSAATPGAKKVILSRLRDAKKRAQIESCRSCGLVASRNIPVPWSGPTGGRAHLIVVGEAPGAEEDRQGVPFVGASGKLLDRLLKEVGTDRKHVFVCNTLCCRPPRNRDPKPSELESCRPNFDMQLSLAGIHVGVALGGFAIANVLGLPRASVTVADYLEKPVWKDGRIWLGTYHPAYALRNPTKKATIKNTLQMALAIRWGEASTPWPAWDQVEALGRRGGDIGPSLDKQGWVLAFWPALNQQVVVVDERKRAKIPAAVAHLPRYTTDELIALGELGAGRKVDAPFLQTIHMVKHEFGGTVVLDERKVSR